MTKHNKKRNIGIMYELMLRHISRSLIEGNMPAVKKLTKIIEKRLSKNTELYKEFRLVNALVNSNVNSTELAASILIEAKRAVQSFDNKKIEKEKSDLIRAINYTVTDKSFYYQNIPNYTTFALIDNVLNEWKKGQKNNLRKLVESEKKVIDWMLTEKKVINIDEEKKNLDMSKSDLLVQKIMVEKINDKYGSLLPEQKDIIKNYAMYSTDDLGREKLSAFLFEMKKATTTVLQSFEKVNENIHVAKKFSLVKNKIDELDPADLTDNSIMKFLTLTKLISEIKE
jgi:hypothetical protein